MAAQLKQLQSKACQAKQFLSTHGSVYYKDIMEKNKQYVQSPATVEKCNELSKQLFYTRLASDGHHIFMVASPDGRCYLVNKQSGKIYWTVETDGLLRIADRGENVNDYADLKQGDYNSHMYHFQPNRSLPQLIPYDTAELLEEHFNWHYGEDGTEVSIKEKDYLIEYQSGVVNGSFDSEREVVESEDWLDYFIIKRVDYYLYRSSPMWSLQFASIKAWFPSSCDKKSFRVPCLLYHAPDARSFINVCKNYNLQPLPSGCPLNE